MDNVTLTSYGLFILTWRAHFLSIEKHTKRQIKFKRLLHKYGKLTIEYKSLMSVKIESLVYPYSQQKLPVKWISSCQDTVLFWTLLFKGFFFSFLTLFFLYIIFANFFLYPTDNNILYYSLDLILSVRYHYCCVVGGGSLFFRPFSFL